VWKFGEKDVKRLDIFGKFTEILNPGIREEKLITVGRR
jgi:hypothetical protein